MSQYNNLDLNINADYHTHTTYSHGKGTIYDNYVEACKKNLDYIAITDHGLDHTFFGIKEKDLPKMRAEIDEINSNSLSTKVLLGIEMDFKGEGGEIDYPKKYPDLLDIVVCGFHKSCKPSTIKDFFKLFLPSMMYKIVPQTKRQKEAATMMYTRAIQKYKIDIISHINREIKVDVLEVARCAEEYGTYLEISSRHQDLTDDEYDILFNKTKVNFVLNSDAHKIDNIANVEFAKNIVKKYGVDLNRIHNINNDYISLRSHGFKNIKDLI